MRVPASVERLGDHFFHGLFVEDGNAQHLPREFAAHEEIGDNVDIGAERQVLVDGLDAGGLGLGRGLGEEFAALEQHAARRRLQPAGDDLDQRRLAGAVVAEQRHDLALADGEADALERFDGAVVLVDVVEDEQRFETHAASPLQRVGVGAKHLAELRGQDTGDGKRRSAAQHRMLAAVRRGSAAGRPVAARGDRVGEIGRRRSASSLKQRFRCEAAQHDGLGVEQVLDGGDRVARNT